MSDDVVTELTAEEFREAARARLDQLGLTYPELAAQARARDFESAQANMLWKMIGNTGLFPEE